MKYDEKVHGKILSLVLIKIWFDMIASGQKPEEYRELTPYWYKRLGPLFKAPPAFVYFGLGYASSRPTMLVKFEGITIGKGRPEWGAVPGKSYFIIKLGHIKDIDYGK